MQSKVSRLRREPKDALIAKLVSLERMVAKQRDAENRLREEILRLSAGDELARREAEAFERLVCRRS